jgi:hypothetical protein
VARTVEQLRENPQGEPDRIRFLLLNLGETLPLEPLEIDLWERGMEDYVAEDIERRVQVFGQRLQRDAGDVQPGAGRQVGP